MSNIFKGYQFVLDLDPNFNFKQKKEFQKKITNNGGTINAALTNETNFLIVSNTRKTKLSYKGRTAQKNSTPIVSTDFVKRCLKEKRVVDTRVFMTLGSEFEEGKIKGKLSSRKLSSVKEPKFNFQEIRVWKWGDNKAPEFDEDNYEVAKSYLLQSNPFEALFYQLELHVIAKARRSKGKHFNFRVFCHYGNGDQLKDASSGTKECRYLQCSSDALEVYKYLFNLYRDAPHNYIKSDQFISRWIGSDKQRKISMESSLESGAVSKQVIELIEHIWQEAYEQLNALISLPDSNINKTKVDKAEAVLLQIRHILDTNTSVMELKQLSEQFFSLIHLDKDRIGTIQDKATLAKVHDICQLIKDIECLSEATNFSPRNTMQAKVRALHCHVEHLPSSSPEYKTISDLVRSSTESGRNKFDIKNIFAVNRAIEATNFTHHLGNKRLLFHASRPANFVGILTRGLLLPKIVVDDFGGQLTDPGNLGSGIYFTDSASTSGKYSSRSKVKGSRFMLVNEVALGKCLDMKSKNYTLSAAPEGYDSVHGVKKTHGMRTQFVDDEFVVYNKNQQRIRYLVEFKLPNDAIKDIIQMSLQEIRPSQDSSHSRPVDINLNTIESLKNPMDNLQAGLQSKSNNSVPLTAVHIRAQLIDLTAQVVVLQAYRNDSNVPIEAKYVFPLDDMAAVCGFEAFIDGKHIIGEVKDKEVAHHEYKEAIRKGHGAYLMDEETPDVFTVSVGNLPPNSDVLIKITYVAELGVESGKVMFSLPGSVAPWKKDSALSQTTQEQMETLKVSGQPTGTSIQISILMPYDICLIESPTHPIRFKKSSTNATVELRKNTRLEGSGFQLLIQLAEIHVPRMWIERHPDKTNSQACMLTFYPDFESKEDASPEILFFLDMSNSMDVKNQMQAQTIVMLILKHLPKQATFNIITFGTSFNELFPVCQPATTANIKSARSFVACAKANMGNTDLWRPLNSYFLLSDETCVRNIFLISDGHINNEESTLAAIQLNANCNRVFTFGISATANKHLLKSIARVGTGAFEFFDTSLKSRWAKKIKSQLLKAMQPVLSNVNVEWEQLEDSAPKPIQAPSQITSLFSGSRQVVYGYVPCCRQATLKAEINGEEISTKVSTNELNITRGKILHQLTARAIIRDWEDGTLDVDPVEHDIKKEAQKSYIIDLSKEYSIVTQFTSFIAVEERNKTDFVDAIFKPSINDLVAKEDVDTIPYVSWEDTLKIEDVESDLQIPPEKTTEDNLCYSAMEMKIYSLDPMEFACKLFFY
ncbi:protein mono-ADP-ribosyltransferase PARP4-like isoform X2 [Antedon mediterranea]|uniref:protein mono-ADP-ribosyltransferase PARP4-like isoform X2 n=1 Tax=Antedon mediterranea TaxID=105859 RepID=UPI003AF94DE5